MFIDTHLHLNSKEYSDPKAVVNEAKIYGVKKFITIGTTFTEFEELKDLCKLDDVYATLGIYPTYDNEFSNDFLAKQIRNYLPNEKIVGIGECGFNIPFVDHERNLKEQEEIFRIQIELALEFNLPLVVHTRNADFQTYDVLKDYKHKNLRGVVHCFVSDYEFAKKILDLGFYVSFNGIITYKSGEQILETITKIPINRILLETDAPHLTPQNYRKEVNYPKYIPIIAQKIADTTNKSLDKIEEITTNNSLSLFDKIGK
jgi:TatD DNase family protein